MAAKVEMQFAGAVFRVRTCRPCRVRYPRFALRGLTLATPADPVGEHLPDGRCAKMEPVPEDSEAKEVDDLEAHEIAAQRVVDLQTESYEHLVASYLNRSVHDEIVGATGTTFDVEVQAFWEDSRRPGTLLVRVTVDWPQRGLRRLAIGDFLVAADGSIVGEHEPEWLRAFDNVRHPVWVVLSGGVATGLIDWLTDWIFRSEFGSPSVAGSLFIGLWMAGAFALLFGVRRSWVRRRRLARTKVATPPRKDGPGTSGV
jgi:hypothetical protein